MNTYCGTPYFMSPEMITDWETCNGNDVWALGIIMYELIIGKLPFKGERQEATFSKIRESTPYYP